MRPLARFLCTLLLPTAIISGGLQLAHVHADTEPGIYNENCPLADFAQRAAGATLPSVDAADHPLLVSDGPERTDGVALPSITPLPSRSRAPPLS